MQYLLSVAIGPVQEFIASARRSRDLWFGSWLLSELAKTVAKAIGKENLVFPSIQKDADLQEGSPFNVVNKIVAIIETGDPHKYGTELEAKVRTRLTQLRTDAFHNIAKQDSYLEANAIAQIDDLVEFYWSAVPLNGNYAQARQDTERLLAARKNTRDFAAVTWASNHPKSSLDGLRESVIEAKQYPDRKKDTLATIAAKAKSLRRNFDVRPTEQLCGVGLLKRLGNPTGEDGFLSSSHIAAQPLLTRLSEIEMTIAQSAVQGYLSTLTNHLGVIEETELRRLTGRVPARHQHPVFGRYDGHLLFEERLTEFVDPSVLPHAQEALKVFFKTAFGDRHLKPVPYYAVLLADGDHMGKAIDAQTTQHADPIEAHRQISAQLSCFAAGVKEIVEQDYQGSLIYAGGDDVLALVPLHMAIACARALAKSFGDFLSPFKFIQTDAAKASPTLSVGLAIVHHIDPLSDALALARDAEKEVKRIPGKNALCVMVSKRSGAITTVADGWGAIDRRLHYFTLLHLAEAIPDGAAYELRNLATQLAQIPDAVPREAIRILQRKRAEKGQAALSEQVLQKLAAMIEPGNLALLANELIVARLLAEAQEQAGMTAEQARQQLKESAE